MTDLSTLTPMGQDTPFYSLATDGLGKEFSLDARPNAVELQGPGEQDRGTLPIRQYEIEAAKKNILRHDPAWEFYVIARLEDNDDFHPLPRRTESLTASADFDYADKEASLKIHLRYEILKLFNVIDQPEASKAFHLYSQSTVPLIAKVVLEDEKSVILDEMSKRFDAIAQREDSWDEFESKKPLEVSLGRARCLMEKLLNTTISKGYSWRKPYPYICSDEDGYITVEWQGEGRRLRLRIEEDEVEYIKLWRINTKRKVRAYRMRSDDCFEIWEWLING